jgi:hypothetical protein
MALARCLIRCRLFGALALVALTSLGACASPPPELAAYAYRPDFSSPEASGRSFLVAWSLEQPETEYLALSEAWKAEVGGTLDAYILARPQIEQQVGWSGKHAWRLQPVRREVGPRSMVLWWGLDESKDPLLGMVMVPQNYLEFEEAGGAGKRPGSYLEGELDEFYGIEGSLLWIEVEDSSARMASRLPKIGRIELGTEWKIRGLLEWQPPEDIEAP